MSTSKLQRKISQELSHHFGGYTIRENIRPLWLSTDNGGSLELDFFIEEVNVAVEVQGKQHYEFVGRFHRNSDGFKSQIERDKLKKELCFSKGITLLEISNSSDISHLIQKIMSLIPSKDADTIFLEKLKEQNKDPLPFNYNPNKSMKSLLKKWAKANRMVTELELAYKRSPSPNLKINLDRNIQKREIQAEHIRIKLYQSNSAMYQLALDHYGFKT